MKTKNALIILIVCIAIIGLFVWGYTNQKGTVGSVQGVDGSRTTKSLLVAPETLYDFGTISMKNGNVAKEFKVTNPTNNDITIATVFTSCMCTMAYIVETDGKTKGPFGMSGMGYIPPANEIVKAGESRVIRAVYNPNAHGPAGVGAIDRFVILTDNSNGTLELEIKALVTP